MVDRPSTSKPRGICRYYKHPRGCFAGKHCKFLHADPAVDDGPNVRLTPYDQAKTCRYYNQGYCKRGDKCWFLHISSSTQKESTIEETEELCSICLEKPSIYGLLAGCSHIFCITCLKQWREPTAKSADLIYSGVHKKCPMCRVPSKFITPSSLFIRHDDPAKAEVIDTYKQSMARVPCKYFIRSLAKDKNDPMCPFGKDCFFKHAKEDGTPYLFTEGVDESMRRYQARHRPEIDSDILNGIFASFRSPFDLFSRLLEDERLDQIQATLQAVRERINRFDVDFRADNHTGSSQTPEIDYSFHDSDVLSPVLDWSFDEANFMSGDSPNAQISSDVYNWMLQPEFDVHSLNYDPLALESMAPRSATQAGPSRISPDDTVDMDNESMPELQSLEDSDSDADDLRETASEDGCTDTSDSGHNMGICISVDSPFTMAALYDPVDESPLPVSLANSPASTQTNDAAVAPGQRPNSHTSDMDGRAPFVTDGRGRVVGASGEDEGSRSWLSRIMDIF